MSFVDTRSSGSTQRALVALLTTFVLAAAGLGASGCATGSGGEVTDAAADVLLPPREEERLGRQLQKQVLEEMTVLENERVQQYVDQLGAKVVRAAGGKPKGIDYSFTVLKDDQVNAFAMPGGDIYVYTGLMKAAKSEAELVSVLAHEVAHVTERHIAEQLVAQYGLQALAGAALGNNPGVVSQILASVAGQGYLLKFSRSAESQADRTGLRYLVRAGYDPSAFVDFFQTMEQQGGARPPEFLSSHPSPENRISQLRKLIARIDNPPTEMGRERYQQMLQTLNGQPARTGSGSTDDTRRRRSTTDDDSASETDDTTQDTNTDTQRRRRRR
jgi:predicted Zn-dependent protease